jgi:hypothetical protein
MAKARLSGPSEDKSSMRPSFAAGERQGQRKQDMPDQRSSSNYFSKIVDKNCVFR